MKRPVKKVLSALLACLLCLTVSGALAGSSAVEVDGTVINTSETPVVTAYTGNISQIAVREGSRVKKGDTIATLTSTKVYAAEDGIVRLFGSVGDSASMITAHYGAVAYIEPAVAYTISASTRNAYDSRETKIIHPGEKVYLRSTSTLTNVGTGTVTQVSGSSFTVDVLEGVFDSGESIGIYRDEAYSNTLRIGRGSISLSSYTAYEGSGIITAYRVADGSEVKKGDILFETIEGEFAGYQTDLTEIKAPADGVIGSLSVTAGAGVTAGDTICTLYPDENMRVEAAVNEEFLSALSVGTAVRVHFTYISGGEYIIGGIVEEVSASGYTDEESETDESFFKSVIKLDDITDISYGMTVTVTN
ncbi:MAG: biotin/lipoyl-binding protein [Clostridia bacterium]|nr:biotin/lipoyl-binding protein [Clostridia bacterium]